MTPKKFKPGPAKTVGGDGVMIRKVGSKGYYPISGIIWIPGHWAEETWDLSGRVLSYRTNRFDIIPNALPKKLTQPRRKKK